LSGSEIRERTARQSRETTLAPGFAALNPGYGK
jgi:hypothetical protein